MQKQHSMFTQHWVTFITQVAVQLFTVLAGVASKAGMVTMIIYHASNGFSYC